MESDNTLHKIPRGTVVPMPEQVRTTCRHLRLRWPSIHNLLNHFSNVQIQRHRGGSLYVVPERGRFPQAPQPSGVGDAEERPQSTLDRLGQWQIRSVLVNQSTPNGVDQRTRWIQTHSAAMLSRGADSYCMNKAYSIRQIRRCIVYVLFKIFIHSCDGWFRS